MDEFRQANFSDKNSDIFQQGFAYLESVFSNTDRGTETETKRNTHTKFYQNHLLNIYKNKFFKAVTIFEAISNKFAESAEVISDVYKNNLYINLLTLRSLLKI